jgi:hypothetical protein
MVQAFPFSGFQNFDDPDEVINPTHHREAWNCVFNGIAPNLRVENTPGTREKTNPYLINDGGNLAIGRYYDPVNKRIFFFNYRADSNKAIYMYDTILGVFYRLAEGGINAEVGALAFTDTGIISNINIIYGDSTQGDILFFLDSHGVPKKLNIQRAIAGGYGTITADDMDVAKQPADIPPYCVYEDDAANTVNNLRKKLFRFKIRWVFDDNDKSVTSSQSEMPIPFAAFDQTVDADPTKNCRISVVYQTGPSNVKKIEIIASNSLGNVMSDWYLVTSIDKSVDNIPNNDVATFLFYNDKAYQYIDISESNQTYDYVPINAGTQTLLNGNVLAYGNITEGYANLTSFSNGSNTSALTSSYAASYAGIYFVKLIGSQDGQSGFESGNIHVVVRGIVLSPSFSLDTYTVYFTDGTNISYTLSVGDDAAAVINGLRADAISKGFTIIGSGSNDLYIFKTNISLARTFISSNYQYNAITNTSFNVYDWSSKYGFGLVYFDQKGRTNGVVYTDGFSIQSVAYSENTSPNDIPLIQGSIYHRPPDWGYYYQWVRTQNLSKQTFVQWISDRTYKETVAITGIIKYAYISIESLNAFKTANPGSPLGYSFTSGDRIKFFKRFNSDGTTANLYGNTRDYEIVASTTNPTINGQLRTGQFVKIVLPPTDGNFDFGGSGYDNYFIELYTPAQPVANNLNLYYEFGERYAIGNPTLATRFHQGMLQNQTTDLATPATFEWTKGDDYIRLRAIQTGNIYTYAVANGGTGGSIDTILIGLNFQGSTYNDPNITAQSVPFVPLTGSFNPGADSRWFLKAITNTTFKIKGTITMTFTDASAGDSWRVYTENRFGDQLNIVAPFDASGASTYSFTIDSSITLEDDRIFLIAASNVSTARNVTFSATNITFTVDHIINQKCIDPNFSDYYASAVNSNGRAFVFDPNANQVTFPVMYRWSLAYQRGTNINQTNRFYSQNFDEVDRSWGAIKRMMIWDRILTFFQERKCGQAGVYKKFITDTAGNQQLITTTNIITENNVQYYAGDFGVGNQADAIVQSGFVYYFVDPTKGKQLRLSRDGITDLSELYKTQTWAAENISKYLTNYNYAFGGTSRITGAFNVRKDNVGEYLCVLQPGTNGAQTLIGQTMGFDEDKNSFTSRYSFAPECIVCAENTLYSWVNGRLYIHDQTAPGTKNKFYGVVYESSITRVFNEHILQKKSWISVSELSNVIWDVPEISTNQFSYGTTVQQSNLVTEDFNQTENEFNASFLGDSNSVSGLINGDTLKGSLLKAKFRLQTQDAINPAYFAGVLIKYIDSPYNSQ